MPIEIKQLHVRSQIVQRAGTSEASSDDHQEEEKQAAQQKIILEECRRMIAATLERQRER